MTTGVAKTEILRLAMRTKILCTGTDVTPSPWLVLQ